MSRTLTVMYFTELNLTHQQSSSVFNLNHKGPLNSMIIIIYKHNYSVSINLTKLFWTYET